MRCQCALVWVRTMCLVTLLGRSGAKEEIGDFPAEAPRGTDMERMAALPTYVISASEPRWQRTRQATRVVPLKLSAKLAHDAHKRHDYDENADLEDPTTWRYFSLTATWERLMHHISHDVDMEDGDFACIFEDDVALHDDVSHATARKAILRSMDLARSDGLVYFGSCYAGCDLKSAVEWVSNVRLEKCINLCTHAMAVTKRKAATLMAELHDEVRADFEQHNYHSIHLGYVIDQMLKVYQRRRNGMWTVGTNLWSAQDKYNMSIGAFFQDRWRVKSSIGGQQ